MPLISASTGISGNPNSNGELRLDGVCFSRTPEDKQLDSAPPSRNSDSGGNGGSPQQEHGSGNDPHRSERNSRLKKWGTTAALIFAGFLGTNLLGTRTHESKAPAAVAPNLSTVATPDELFKLLAAGEKLEKTAYQLIEGGFFTYYLPYVGDTEQIFVVRGIAPQENPDFMARLAAAQVSVQDGGKWLEQQKQDALREITKVQAFYSVLRSAAVFGMLGGLVIYLFRRAEQKGGLPFGLPGMTGAGGHILTDRPDEGFDHVGGVPTVVEALRLLTKDIDLRQQGRTDIEVPKGLLLIGPTGTGKTMLARAVAAETKCPFVSFKGSDLSTQFFVGSGVARVREAFEQARELRDEHTTSLREAGNPNAQGICIMFVDELDSLASQRNFSGRPADKETTKEVNALLAEMDNIDKGLNANIIVIGASNADRNNFDPAVIRPGRFNSIIDVPNPESKEARLEILQKTMQFKFAPKGYAIDDGVSLERIARISPGSSGADMVGILEKAVAIARREDRKRLTMSDLMEGFQELKIGFRSSLNIPVAEREVTGQHEIGHGLVARACGVKTILISMQPRGKQLGRVILDPQAFSEYNHSKEQLLKRLLISVAGQVAETLRFGELGTTTGASGDLDDCRRVLRLLISTGLLGESFATSLSDDDPSERPEELSDEHRRLIDAAVKEAKLTASKIIACVPKGDLNRMVAHALTGDGELMGDEAAGYYDQFVNHKVEEQMRAVLNEYLQNPLGAHYPPQTRPGAL